LIFRRGEHKIQERKKRNARFLACGATFGLCLILCGIFLIPRKAETASGEQKDASQKPPSVSVVFFDPQGSSQEVGRGNAAQIYFSVQSAFSENSESVKNDDVISESVPNQGVSDSVVFPSRDEGDQSLDHDGNVSDKNNGNGAHGNGIVNGSGPVEYRIVLTDEQGKETTYRLKGNALTEESSGKKVLLSKAQLEELLALFDEK
jgi:hypothetical protein